MTAECLSHLFSALAIRRRKARMAAKRFIKERIAHKMNSFEFFPFARFSRELRPLPIHNRQGEFIHVFGALFSSSDSMNEISSVVVRKNSFFASLHGRVAFLASSFRFPIFCGNFRVFVDFWPCQLNIRKAVNEADGLLGEQAKNTRARVPLNDHQVLRCHRSTREM